jgi:catechol 2,3-dioxygenase-like lactoylglutathione lyase family enzyme
VSIHADDLEESVRFYVDLFGMERLPTPNFGEPVAWLKLGEQQLHLFQRPVPSPESHHVAFDVDDFEAAYVKAKELGLIDRRTFAGPRVLPDGSVQMYLRDPAGNLVELDWPDAGALDRSAVPELQRLADDLEQTGDAREATLYHARERAHGRL